MPRKKAAARSGAAFAASSPGHLHHRTAP
jgi:hypothetical protein